MGIHIPLRKCLASAIFLAFFLPALRSAPQDKEIRISGLVLAVEENPRAILVAHRPVPGWMPAMTMRFEAPLGPRVQPGDQVEFVVQPAARPLTARSLRLIPPDRGGIPHPPARLPIGADVPDFELLDSEERPTRLSEFRGKVVVLQFIYTRCPVAEACPRLAATFAALRRQLTPAESSQVAFLSITIDPDYDTPNVLRDYASRWGVEPAKSQNWRFLTGPLDRIAPVAEGFGLVFWPDEGAIGHTTATAFLTRNGQLGAIVEGTSFRLDQWAGLLRRFLGGAK
jgi:protein SCO1